MYVGEESSPSAFQAPAAVGPSILPQAAVVEELGGRRYGLVGRFLLVAAMVLPSTCRCLLGLIEVITNRKLRSTAFRRHCK